MAKASRKPRRGRPPFPKGTSKAAMLVVRMQPVEKAAIDAAAGNEGMAVSDWVRSTLLVAAGHVNLDNEAEGGGVEPRR